MFIRSELIEGIEDHYYIYYYESDAPGAKLLKPVVRAYIDFDKWSSVEEFAQYIYEIDSDPNYYVKDIPQEEREYQILLNKCYFCRREEYPQICEQLDMLYHEVKAKNIISQDGDWYNLIKSIKEKYPKPQESV